MNRNPVNLFLKKATYKKHYKRNVIFLVKMNYNETDNSLFKFLHKGISAKFSFIIFVIIMCILFIILIVPIHVSLELITFSSSQYSDEHPHIPKLV